MVGAAVVVAGDVGAKEVRKVEGTKPFMLGLFETRKSYPESNVPNLPATLGRPPVSWLPSSPSDTDAASEKSA